MPRYEMELHERPVEITRPDLAERLQSVGKGQVLAIETILTEAKLEAIIELAKPGTLVYSQFVDSIFPMIREELTRRGFRVAAFNGEDKSGVELFKKREVDVLIGSSALGTGVDGLRTSVIGSLSLAFRGRARAMSSLSGASTARAAPFTTSKFSSLRWFCGTDRMSGRGIGSASPVSTTKRHLPMPRSMASCQRLNLRLRN